MDQSLQRAIAAAATLGVRQSVEAFRATHPSSRLLGYALLTDDGLGGVFAAALSDHALAEAPEVRFQPVDWTESAFGENDHYLDETSALMAEGERATSEESFADYVDSAFAALVSALSELKAESIFDDDVFLCVGSTDPSEHLQLLEERAGRRLNSERLFEQFRREGRRGTLICETKAAVKQSLAQLGTAPVLAAYVLLTNDHVRTVRPAVCSVPASRFAPSEEWPVLQDTAFNAVRSILSAEWVPSFDGQSPWAIESHYVNESFDALTTALMELREDGVFGDGVFLAVRSSDRSGFLGRLEDAAMRHLNDETVYDAWRSGHR